MKEEKLTQKQLEKKTENIARHIEKIIKEVKDFGKARKMAVLSAFLDRIMATGITPSEAVGILEGEKLNIMLPHSLNRLGAKMHIINSIKKKETDKGTSDYIG